MADNTEMAPEQAQPPEKKLPLLQRWRIPEWLRIPGKNSESVIGLECFITTHYPDNNYDYLNKRFLVAVQQFDNSEHVNSKQYDLFQRTLIILSALTSFFIALEAFADSSIVIKLIALLLSLLVGILGNYLTSFNIQAKRGAYRHTRELLISEFYKFHEGVGPYSQSTDKADQSTAVEKENQRRKSFATEVEGILAVANETWEKLHQQGQGQTNQPGQADQTEEPKQR